jgi:hypothetical protein
MYSEVFNLFNHNGFFTYRQFNNEKFHMMLALRWVFCTDLKTESDSSCKIYVISLLVFITVVESVYSAVRTDALYEADYVSSL